jgi:hypothetical protein
MFNRPNHPDFWLISQALIDTDAVVDSGQEKPGDVVDRYVDRDTLMYVTHQRALKTVLNLNIDPASDKGRETIALIMGTWFDAFVAGAKFQHLKTSKAQEFTEPDEETPS